MDINETYYYPYGGSYQADYYWRFTVSDTTPASQIISFSIRITDNSGYSQTFSNTFAVIEGTIQSDGDGDGNGDIPSEGDNGDGNGSTGFPPIDWSLFGLGLLIFAGIAVSVGSVYANHHYHWRLGYKIKGKFINYSSNRYTRKQRKKKASELEANKFENLIKKSKELINKGKDLYSKEFFLKAIDEWRESITFYSLAVKKAPSSLEKTKIKDNIKILRKNISEAYVNNGKQHNLTAKKAHKDEKIHIAQKEWHLAIKDFETSIALIKSEKLDIDYDSLELKINAINLNLIQLEIEKICLNADEKLRKARSLQDNDLKEATNLVQDSLLEYLEAKEQTKKHPEFQELLRRIQIKMENNRNFQLELQDKMDDLLGILPLTTKVIIDDEEESISKDLGTIIKAEKKAKALSINREYEHLGGQVRFKIALINNTRSALTNFNITFRLPDALKWIKHEPNYDRKGDSIFISKLGVNEKKTVSLYLEPINCLESPINATVSFFDRKDRPQAVIMSPKKVSITCPIFFTKEEVNLARVKHLQRSLTQKQKKILPISNIEKISLIFSSILSVLGKHDIKLVYKELSVKGKLGEAWYYGVTKVKERRLVTYILLDGEINTLELEVSGDHEEQITGFLAEIGNEIKQELLKHKIISLDDRFYNMRCSVLLNECPFCGGPIPAEVVQKYEYGESINCKFCGKLIINITKI